MADTPKRLLEALDLVTAKKPKRDAAQPETVAVHHERVRAAFEDPNIVAVGISEKETQTKRTGELSLCFYVVKKKSARELHPRHLVPPVIAVREGAAVFTDVKAIGKIVPQKKTGVNKKTSPLQSGYSVCHYQDTAGTLGAVVRKQGRLCILSNSHVLARGGMAKKGDAILYPGPYDGGTLKANKVAALSDFKPFVAGGNFENRVDAALAQIVPERARDINYAITAARKPLRIVKPVRGMRVVKFGRTTGRTEGVVRDIHFRVVIGYDGVGQVGFLDQVLCDRYTAGGDSGSIVVDKASGGIVGLHFSGSSQGSIFTPMQFVMDELGFRFASR